MQSILKKSHPAILLCFWILSCATTATSAETENSAANNYNSTSLCAKYDEIYFSCKTKNAKIISFCGTGNERDPKHVYYRYGRVGKIEMEHPKVKNKESISQFSYLQHSRAGMSAISVFFHNYSYMYEIIYHFDTTWPGGEINFSGINVYQNGKRRGRDPVYFDIKSVDIKCESEILNRLDLVRWFLSCKGEEDSPDCFPKKSR
jgi:hypothetical protein